ncbi:E3 ubiquitin ligase RBR family [Trema orientale]|uniref:RBR-type E3 ubiquitin transferase n=1 Tax=Trema orientale TaxID=63057 RepID=A0A2P5ASZ1_TREOI|nr:E3 ubiquitin ligase RBR family [Trema orientale]
MRRAEQGRRNHAHRSDRTEVLSSSSLWKALNQDQSLTPDLGLTSPLSASQPQTFEPTSNSVPRISKNSPNPMWVSRNQRGSGLKPRFVKKSEVGSKDSEVGSSNHEVGFFDSEVSSSNHEVGSLGSEVGSLSIDEREDAQVEKVEKDEREGCGNGLGSESEVVVESSEEEEEESNDVMDILEELRLSAEEPELSEEQLMSNCQSQKDELLALESIYGEDVFFFDTERGLKSFQVHVHIEAPNGITVTTKLNSSGDLKTTGNNPDEFSYSFDVQYLPPIVLTCLLPKSYPSHLPPYFTISVQWLDSVKIATLCSMLDSIWNEQPGQEVTYQWVEWLNSSSLSYLGFDKEIMLGPYGIKHSADRRAVSGNILPDIDFPFIRNYNDERLNEIFQQSIHECCICFSEYAGSEFIRLPCHHFFCRICMKTYSDIHVNEGTVNKLQCPDAKCRGMVPPSVLRRLLSDEEYERWESLTLQKTLESMSDITYCPRCETPCVQDEGEHAQCSMCFFNFCTRCGGPRHVGTKCLSREFKLQMLQERQNSSLLKGKQKRRERDRILELRSLRKILRDSKQCPSCKMAIYKSEGCNKMICSNCGQIFCYQCNKPFNGFGAFRHVACGVDPEELMEDWEERKNPRPQVVAQVKVEVLSREDGPGQICPTCRQFNLKVGKNNHLFCRACQVHYCYLCKKIVKRSSEHYGPKGCKQHTEG